MPGGRHGGVSGNDAQVARDCAARGARRAFPEFRGGAVAAVGGWVSGE